MNDIASPPTPSSPTAIEMFTPRSYGESEVSIYLSKRSLDSSETTSGGADDSIFDHHGRNYDSETTNSSPPESPKKYESIQNTEKINYPPRRVKVASTDSETAPQSSSRRGGTRGICKNVEILPIPKIKVHSEPEIYFQSFREKRKRRCDKSFQEKVESAHKKAFGFLGNEPESE